MSTLGVAVCIACFAMGTVFGACGEDKAGGQDEPANTPAAKPEKPQPATKVAPATTAKSPGADVDECNEIIAHVAPFGMKQLADQLKAQGKSQAEVGQAIGAVLTAAQNKLRALCPTMTVAHKACLKASTDLAAVTACDEPGD